MTYGFEMYKCMSARIIDRFFRREIGFAECRTALSDELTKAKRQIEYVERIPLADTAKANNGRVVAEMEKRQRNRIEKSGR